jgi:purine-binding chemotaxis protein CheW
MKTWDAGTLVDAAGDAISVCLVRVDGQVFGIDTRQIREVLGKTVLQRVPLAAKYVAGVASYRGEVLTTLSLRVLLGMAESTGASYVVVLEDPENEVRFGLAVDTMGGVAMVSQRTLEPNPSTLDAHGRALFAGAYQVDEELVAMLDLLRLRRSRLPGDGLIKRMTEEDKR